MQSKRDIDIMRVEKRRKNEGERVEMLESTEIVKKRERESYNLNHKLKKI